MTVDLTRLITAEAKAADALATRRAGMSCSRLQGRLTLGPEACAVLDAIADDPAEPWPLRETIRNAAEWHRNSETIDALAWVLGYTAEEMDAMFEAARMVMM